ncbi:uncharacterized protein N0V89_007688 [Didymosphaeria variabile]|uniref:Uncharacterized protein n=1 Tax=Didymosphaeria variabile TaxID=1932322 RepID=A0A9W8XLZ1_9PLEO|nr:uncharacterized protein N0V89_007688 [Didymosphaeria variabile]KAJ4352340.1 hypothetical protein N0V89_007688 [Didymosphaeria variabile]
MPAIVRRLEAEPQRPHPEDLKVLLNVRGQGQGSNHNPGIGPGISNGAENDQTKRLRDRVNELRRSLGNTEAELQDSQASVTALQANLANSQATVRALQADEVAKRLEETESALVELQEEFDILQTTMFEAQATVNVLKQEQEHDRSTYAKLRENLDNYRAKDGSLAEECNDLRGKISRLRPELASVRKELEKAQSSSSKYRLAFEHLQSEFKAVQDEIASRREEVGNLTAQHNVATQEVARLQQQLESQTAGTEELRQRTEKLDATTHEVSRLKKELASHIEKLRVANNEIKDLNEEIQGLHTTMSDQQEKLTNLRTEKEKLQKKLDEARKEATREQEKHQNESTAEKEKQRSDLKEEVQKLTNSLELAEKRSKAAASALKSSKSNREKLEQDLSGAQSENKINKDRVTDLEEKLEKLTQDGKPKSDEVQALQKKISQLVSQQKQNRQDISSLTKERDTASKEVESLRQKVSQQQPEQKSTAENGSQLDLLTKQLQEAQGKNKELEKEKEDLLVDIDLLNDIHEEEAKNTELKAKETKRRLAEELIEVKSTLSAKLAKSQEALKRAEDKAKAKSGSSKASALQSERHLGDRKPPTQREEYSEDEYSDTGSPGRLRPDYVRPEVPMEKAEKYAGPPGSRKILAPRFHRPKVPGNNQAPRPAMPGDLPPSQPTTKQPVSKSGALASKSEPKPPLDHPSPLSDVGPASTAPSAKSSGESGKSKIPPVRAATKGPDVHKSPPDAKGKNKAVNSDSQAPVQPDTERSKPTRTTAPSSQSPGPFDNIPGLSSWKKPEAAQEIPGLPTLKKPKDAEVPQPPTTNKQPSTTDQPGKQEKPENAVASSSTKTDAPEQTGGTTSSRRKQLPGIFSMKNNKPKSAVSSQPSTAKSEPAKTNDQPSVTNDTPSTTTKQPKQQGASDLPKTAAPKQTGGPKSIDDKDNKVSKKHDPLEHTLTFHVKKKVPAMKGGVGSDEGKPQGTNPPAKPPAAGTSGPQGSHKAAKPFNVFGSPPPSPRPSSLGANQQSKASAPVAPTTTSQSQGASQSFAFGGTGPSDFHFGFKKEDGDISEAEMTGRRKRVPKVGGQQNIAKTPSQQALPSTTFGENDTFKRNNTAPKADEPNPLTGSAPTGTAPPRSGPTPFQMSSGGANTGTAPPRSGPTPFQMSPFGSKFPGASPASPANFSGFTPNLGTGASVLNTGTISAGGQPNAGFQFGTNPYQSGTNPFASLASPTKSVGGEFSDSSTEDPASKYGDESRLKRTKNVTKSKSIFKSNAPVDKKNSDPPRPGSKSKAPVGENSKLNPAASSFSDPNNSVLRPDPTKPPAFNPFATASGSTSSFQFGEGTRGQTPSYFPDELSRAGSRDPDDPTRVPVPNWGPGLDQSAGHSLGPYNFSGYNNPAHTLSPSSPTASNTGVYSPDLTDDPGYGPPPNPPPFSPLQDPVSYDPDNMDVDEFASNPDQGTVPRPDEVQGPSTGPGRGLDAGFLEHGSDDLEMTDGDSPRRGETEEEEVARLIKEDFDRESD